MYRNSLLLVFDPIPRSNYCVIKKTKPIAFARRVSGFVKNLSRSLKPLSKLSPKSL